MLKIENEIMITCDNFDQKFCWKLQLISIVIPIEIPTKLILVEILISKLVK
jgi:hypothetical protein